MEEDVLGLKRVVVGQGAEVCELCGTSGAGISVERIEGARGVAEPVEVMRLCRDCRDRLATGEIQLDAELAPGLESADD